MTHSENGRRAGAFANWQAGAIGGVLGAIVYTIFVEAVSVATNGLDAFFIPFRQIGAMVLGAEALDPSYDLLVATLAGTVVHFGIAALFGVVVSMIAASMSLRGAAVLVALGAIAGLVMYALNVWVIFPAAFPWFLANGRIMQSVGHALFGAVTGWWLSRRSS